MIKFILQINLKGKRMLKKIGISIVIVGLLGGCANDPLPPELQNIGNSYTCNTDCNQEWAMAQAWVARHAVTNIQVANNNIIQNRTPYSNRGVIIFTANKIGNQITLEMSSTNPLTMVGGSYDDAPKYFYYYLKTGIDNYKPGMLMTAVR